MGLKTDIENAFLKNIKVDKDPDYEVSAEGKEKVSVLAQDLTDAIVKWVVKQEFKITEMEAPINFLPGTINVAGSPAAQANVAPITNTAQISETSNIIMDPRVPTAVKKSKVKLLKAEELD